MKPLIGISRAMLLRLSRAKTIGKVVQRTAWGRRAVEGLVAGNTIEEAVASALLAKRRGFNVTLDRLGEAASGAAADDYVADASRLLDGQLVAGLEPNVSVKLTAIGLSEGEDVAATRLDRILATAQRVNGFVRVDAERPETLDALHRIVVAARASGRPVGTTIQASLRRSVVDVEQLVTARVPILLVRGAYDPGAGGVGDVAAVDAAYLRLAARLLEDNVPLAFGTHKDRILNQLADQARVRVEAQLLYGVRADLADRLLSTGWSVRIYTPYGLEWWPYALRRIAEQPANLPAVVRRMISR